MGNRNTGQDYGLWDREQSDWIRGADGRPKIVKRKESLKGERDEREFSSGRGRFAGPGDRRFVVKTYRADHGALASG